MSLDATFTDLATRGWLVNNLYQEEPNRWRVNLRRPEGTGDWFTDWAYGETLEDALEECMSKLNDAEFTHEPETTHAAVPKACSLAEALGLVPKSTGIRRR